MNDDPSSPLPVAQTRRRTALLLVTMVLLWLSWSGHYTPLLLSLGALSCLGVVFLCLRMGIVDQEGLVGPLGIRFFAYLPYILKEIVLANLVVSRQILAPAIRMSPTLVSIEAKTRSEIATTILANSITLTPGTLTIRAFNGVILVHSLTEEGARILQEGEMNRRVAEMETSQ